MPACDLRACCICRRTRYASANGATIAGSVHYVASATTSCSKGVASMGIYTAPGVLAYVVNGSSLNTSLSLNPATYKTVVESWTTAVGPQPPRLQLLSAKNPLASP